MIFMPRRQDPPDELDPSRPSSCTADAVRIALEEDFARKCYLCESDRRAAQVEHLRPQSAFPEQAAFWDNLFLACGGSCNQRRVHWEHHSQATKRHGSPVRWPEGGMLDPARDADVEQRLHQRLVRVDRRLSARFEAVDDQDAAAVNTAFELDTIHDMNHREGRALCADVQQWHGLIQEALADYWAERHQGRSHEARDKLTSMLGDAAPFAGLMRSKLRAQLAAFPTALKELRLTP